jgi:hypothetical protein
MSIIDPDLIAKKTKELQNLSYIDNPFNEVRYIPFLDDNNLTLRTISLAVEESILAIFKSQTINIIMTTMPT